MLTNPWSQSVHKNRQLIPQKCQRMGFIRLKPIVSSLPVDRSHIPIFNQTPFLISRLRRLMASGHRYRERPQLCYTQHVKNRTYHLLSITSLSPPLPKMWFHQCPLSEPTRFGILEPRGIYYSAPSLPFSLPFPRYPSSCYFSNYDTPSS